MAGDRVADAVNAERTRIRNLMIELADLGAITVDTVYGMILPMIGGTPRN